MKLRRFSFVSVCLLAAIAFLPLGSYAQSAENLETHDGAAISAGRNARVSDVLGRDCKTHNLLARIFLGRHNPPKSCGKATGNPMLVSAAGPGLNEHERLVKNEVAFVGRHCQKYMLNGVLDDGGQAMCASDLTTIFYAKKYHNLRTTVGGDWQASVMGNTAAPPATANYIALSNDVGAPAAGDTTLASEIAANGLSRAQGTYAHTNGTASYTIQKVFTATGTQASQKAALFNASSVGTLVFENTYTPVTVNNGDTLTVTWTINY